jgi:hypothetical protein
MRSCRRRDSPYAPHSRDGKIFPNGRLIVAAMLIASVNVALFT